MLQNVKKVLANPEPSTHGTNAKCRPHRAMSEFGGETDEAVDRSLQIEDRMEHAPSQSPFCERGEEPFDGV